ncbi:MAG: Jag N-terminal domain-containing protein, partial [Eubacteriales bacterium]|nr:Jag N-terminal domain-containing protein [Eubacteriales bacterium]
MEEFVQFSAKTKSEAITKACIELGTSSDQLEIEVVSEGSSGFFGIGSKPAIIKVRKKAEESDDDEIKKIIENVSAVSIAQENKKAEPKTSPAKEKAQEQPKEKKEKPAKEKQPKEKSAKAKPQPKEKEKKQVKAASKPVEILTDEAEIKEIEGRAVTFLKEVFESMDLGEVEIKSVYNREEGCLDVDFEGEDMG